MYQAFINITVTPQEPMKANVAKENKCTFG